MLKTIDLFGHKLSSLELSTTGTDMILLRTTKEASSYITIIRPDDEAVSSNYQLVSLGDGSYLGCLPIGKNLLLETSSSTKQKSAQLYFASPFLSLTLTMDSDNWASNTLLKINAHNSFDSVQLNSSLRLLNHDTTIRSTGTRNDKLNFPRRAEDVEKAVDVRSLFRGPIVDLELNCPMCDG